MIVDIHAYLRKGRNLLKVAGNDPMIRANTPRTTATIEASNTVEFLWAQKPVAPTENLASLSNSPSILKALVIS